MFTDRRQSDFVNDNTNNEGGTGTVYGIDGRLQIKNNLGFNWQVLGSHIKETDAPDLIDLSEDGYDQIYFNRDRNTVALDGESFDGHAVYTGIEYNTNIFKGYILRNRFNYQFTREWFIRLIVQYNDFSKQVDFEPLLTYRINPFTMFYVGVSSNINQFHPDDYDEIDKSVWKMSSRQFFAKFQYLFRI